MWIVGIDLGTTNCALAWLDPAGGAAAAIRDFPVPQLVRPGEVSARALLPSFLYLPAGPELPEAARQLPWGAPPQVAGELARWQGARTPGRVVSSAKAWLSHAGVDRQAPILPWGAPADVPKISPVEASARLLEHLSEAFRAAHPEHPLSGSEVVLTVPASFDEAARALTVSAARRAGFQRFTLLEEPQAALYAFTARRRADLARALEGVRLVLVVDVGGGTTDFTLVQVEVLPGGPALRRIAAGDHLLLGGDNMDAALAHAAERKLSRGRLQAGEWAQLVQVARSAKEALLGERPPDRHALSVAGSGSRLIGGSFSVELARAEVESLVLEGFFPRTPPEELPRRSARMAIQELGLPYVQDPAIPRHLAAFLRAHADGGFAALGEPRPAPEALPRPDAILLNGGVFSSPLLARRVVDVVSAWWPDRPPVRVLEHDSLELAVARGAAYHGLTRRGLGLRIGGGAARAYYAGLSREAGAAGAASGGKPAVCLVPRGFEEGTSVQIERPFTLTLGRPVQFQLYATTADRIDRTGEVVDVSDEAFRPLPPIHTILRSTAAEAGAVPVYLEAALTEIGTLELSCLSRATDERWRLEFELRGASAAGALTVTESMPARFAEAAELVQKVYGHRARPVEEREVKQLVRSLERALGPREGWRVPVLRELWSTLFAGAPKRRRSAVHERLFFHLLGYSLRPGFGYPLDGWRSAETFRLFKELVQYHQEKPVWTEFWVMWRRIGGGLDEGAQRELWSYLRPHLAWRAPPTGGPSGPKPKGGIQPEGLDEMIRAAASLEHLEPEEKAELGRMISARVAEPASSGGPWAWALGRLGARVPLYGSGHRVVPPELAGEWVRLLIGAGLRRVDGAAFAVAQLARLTGDRTRDLEPEVRARALEALVAASAPEGWIRMVREAVALEDEDEARALGDTLPAGLTLAS